MATTDLPRAKRAAKLWMSDADGSNARQITYGTGNESASSFSPDGKWIGFVSTREGGAHSGDDETQDRGQRLRITKNS